MGGRTTAPADDDTRANLLRRLRCVAFACLMADIDEAEVYRAVDIAVEADERRRAHVVPAPRHLQVVR